MKKKSLNKYEILDLIAERWSPRAFDPNKKIEKTEIFSLLEAARWAPSAFNEQPWRFIVGFRDDSTFNIIKSVLIEWNQLWAGNASALVLNIGKKSFTKNGNPNVTFKYDIGQSVAFMILEAMHRGIFSHEMSGFDDAQASRLFKIPEDYQPVSVTAFGYYGDANTLPEDMRPMEFANRSRKNIDTIAFGNRFGKCFEE